MEIDSTWGVENTVTPTQVKVERKEVEDFAIEINKFRDQLSPTKRAILDWLIAQEERSTLVCGGDDGLTVVLGKDGIIRVIPRWNPARRVPNVITQRGIPPAH